MSGDFRWYVVHTYSGYENKVASNLRTTIENRNLHDLFEDVQVPVEKVEEISDGKKKEVERKIFPGYVFIKMVYTDESWYVVKNIRGCTGFVGPESKPVPLSEDEAIKMGVESRVVEVPYSVGDMVRIIDGPFEDRVVRVDDIDFENNTVSVIIQMMGQDTPAELDLDQVEPL